MPDAAGLREAAPSALGRTETYCPRLGLASLPAAPRARAVVILGSGPNRIGQGIEFDYCCVHAARTYRQLGYEAVMVNCNPETVSTDYDTSDRLYFEPLGDEEVLEICAREQPVGVVIQFGGQTPLRLARTLEAAGIPILGTRVRGCRPRRGPRALRRAVRPDRPLRTALGDRRDSRMRRSRSHAGWASRCSSARRTCSAGGTCESASTKKPSPRAPCRGGRVLVDRFLEGAVEIDVDALCDGEDTHVSAVMQHVEEAGCALGRLVLRVAADLADADRAPGDPPRRYAGSRPRSASSGS